jgi:hypothetical protein
LDSTQRQPRDPVTEFLAQEHERREGLVFGRYRGLVREIGTGANLGLIKVIIPGIYGSRELSPWAEPAPALAGPGYGALILPQEDDYVWVDFEEGNPSSPVWSGACWASPEEVPSDLGPQARGLRSPQGHRVIVDDENDSIQIIHRTGARLVIEDKTITLQAAKGKIVLSESGIDFNDGAAKVD